MSLGDAQLRRRQERTSHARGPLAHRPDLGRGLSYVNDHGWYSQMGAYIEQQAYQACWQDRLPSMINFWN